MGLGAVPCLSPSLQHEVGQSQTIGPFPSASAASLPPGTFGLPQVTSPQSLRPTLKPFSSPLLPIILADSSPVHLVSHSFTGTPLLHLPQPGSSCSVLSWVAPPPEPPCSLCRCSPLLAAPRDPELTSVIPFIHLALTTFVQLSPCPLEDLLKGRDSVLPLCFSATWHRTGQTEAAQRVSWEGREVNR